MDWKYSIATNLTLVSIFICLHVCFLLNKSFVKHKCGLIKWLNLVNLVELQVVFWSFITLINKLQLGLLLKL
jgi:hypothetical protein